MFIQLSELTIRLILDPLLLSSKARFQSDFRGLLSYLLVTLYAMITIKGWLNSITDCDYVVHARLYSC